MYLTHMDFFTTKCNCCSLYSRRKTSCSYHRGNKTYNIRPDFLYLNKNEQFYDNFCMLIT